MLKDLKDPKDPKEPKDPLEKREKLKKLKNKNPEKFLVNNKEKFLVKTKNKDTPPSPKMEPPRKNLTKKNLTLSLMKENLDLNLNLEREFPTTKVNNNRPNKLTPKSTLKITLLSPPSVDYL